LRQAKVEIVELSHTTAEGHDMIEAHKLLLCLAEHFASSLKNYQVLHPRNTKHKRTHTNAHGRTRARAHAHALAAAAPQRVAPQ
jgi:hypothetical protein